MDRIEAIRQDTSLHPSASDPTLLCVYPRSSHAAVGRNDDGRGSARFKRGVYQTGFLSACFPQVKEGYYESRGLRRGETTRRRQNLNPFSSSLYGDPLRSRPRSSTGWRKHLSKAAATFHPRNWQFWKNKKKPSPTESATMNNNCDGGACPLPNGQQQNEAGTSGTKLQTDISRFASVKNLRRGSTFPEPGSKHGSPNRESPQFKFDWEKEQQPEAKKKLSAATQSGPILTSEGQKQGQDRGKGHVTSEIMSETESDDSLSFQGSPKATVDDYESQRSNKDNHRTEPIVNNNHREPSFDNNNRLDMVVPSKRNNKEGVEARGPSENHQENEEKPYQRRISGPLSIIVPHSPVDRPPQDGGKDGANSQGMRTSSSSSSSLGSASDASELYSPMVIPASRFWTRTSQPVSVLDMRHQRLRIRVI